MDSTFVGNAQAVSGLSEAERYSAQAHWIGAGAQLVTGSDLTRLDTLGRELLGGAEALALAGITAQFPMQPRNPAQPAQPVLLAQAAQPEAFFGSLGIFIPPFGTPSAPGLSPTRQPSTWSKARFSMKRTTMWSILSWRGGGEAIGITSRKRRSAS